MSELILKEFYSKKNKVYLVEINGEKLIKKTFSNKELCNKEFFILKKLQGQLAPKYIDKSDNEIIMEYIDGCTFLDEIIAADDDKVAIYVRFLIENIKSVYKVINFYPTDLNFRNFLLKNNKCYAIDFENYEDISFEKCVIKILAFLLLYDFPDNKTTEFINVINNYLSSDINLLMADIKEEIQFICNRRKISTDIAFIKLKKSLNSIRNIKNF
jgi:predicted Ser/Thr protein kinase